MTLLNHNSTYSTGSISEDQMFAKKMLNRVVTHFNKKHDFNADVVMFEIYNDLFPAK